MSVVLEQLDIILTQIETDILEVWQPIDKIWDEQPRLEQQSNNYAVIEMTKGPSDSWDVDKGATIEDVSREWEFTITRRMPHPTSSIIRAKATESDRLTSRLCGGPVYATIAFLPLITDRQFEDVGDLEKSAIEFKIVFSCYTVYIHH